MTERIFISYRRDDSFAEAALICAALQNRAGIDAVFMDKSLQPGVDWPEEIKVALVKANTVLVIVGDWNKWLGVQNFGKRRIDDPTDWVHQEATLALKQKKKIIPVLIGPPAGAIQADVLPVSVRPLLEKQRHLLRMDTWDQDLKVLIEVVVPTPIVIASSSVRLPESEKSHKWHLASPQEWARRNKMTVTIIGVTLACVVLSLGFLVRQNIRANQAAILVDKMLATPDRKWERHLKELEPFGDLATDKLSQDFIYNVQQPVLRWRASYGIIRSRTASSEHWLFFLKSVFGPPKDRLDELPEEDSDNLIKELVKEGFSDDLKSALSQRIEESSDDEETKNHYLAVAVGLGFTELAPICTPQNAAYIPEQRTSFIDGFRELNDIQRVAALIIQPDLDPDLRSALCVAIGRMRGEARDATNHMLKKLYVEAPHGGTHGAVRWALLMQQELSSKVFEDLDSLQPLPDLARDWDVTKNGRIVMVKIPGGNFALGDVTDSKNPITKEPPSLFNDFWMSHWEISVGEFETMMTELQNAPDPRATPDPMRLLRPAADMTWFDAVVFCNRLSAKEGFQPYYGLDEENVTKKDAHITAADVSIIDPKGHGYRLPTEAEWEYACRAMSVKDYSFGDSIKKLEEYGVFQGYPQFPIAIPNAWGLCHMHGNLQEWCGGEQEMKGNFRVLRGGHNYDEAKNVRSCSRREVMPEFHDWKTGFRICRTP